MAPVGTVVGTFTAAFVVGTLAGGYWAFHGGPRPGSPGSPGSPGGTFTAASATPAPTPTRVRQAISAHAVRRPDGRVVISGVIPGADPGDPISVQRRQDGAWADFPAGTRAGPGGRYSVWVRTTHPVDRSFRVRDQRTGAVSEPVPLTD